MKLCLSQGCREGVGAPPTGGGPTKNMYIKLERLTDVDRLGLGVKGWTYLYNYREREKKTCKKVGPRVPAICANVPLLQLSRTPEMACTPPPSPTCLHDLDKYNFSFLKLHRFSFAIIVRPSGKAQLFYHSAVGAFVL